MKAATMIAAAAFATATSMACADTIEDFYRGRQIQLIIGVGEGGGYDLSARLAAMHLSKFIPGNPTIVPRNMPAAGSIAAAEYVYSLAPKDGTVLAMFQPTYITDKINDTRRKYEYEKFTYIPRRFKRARGPRLARLSGAERGRCEENRGCVGGGGGRWHVSDHALGAESHSRHEVQGGDGLSLQRRHGPRA